MENILNFLSGLKIFYLILIILVMIIINIILNRKKINSSYKYFINGVSLVMLALINNYFYDVIEGIFNFKFLSVKFYIIILIITNMIILITIQKKIWVVYRIINYLLFGLMTCILGIILIMIIGIKLNLLSLVISGYVVVLLNVSIIIFIVYLVIISLIYIIRTFDNEKSISFSKVLFQKIKNIRIDKKKFISTQVIANDELTVILTPDELLSIPNKKDFSINGVDCSIIFEDSVPENIVKNYKILLNDIDAKLVNGYTLEENKLLKSICTKLKTNSLNCIDLNNLSILNKISVEEYNFLKQIYEK